MSFDVAAEAYDRFMGRFSVPLAVQFAAWAGIRAPARVLDVGCGPGALTGVLAELTGAERVAAVDPSDSFVQAVRERMPGVDVRLASAEELPYADDSFDAALAALVVHLLPDAAGGLAEMVRVTRRGGVVAASVWDFGGHRAPQAPFFAALRTVAPAAKDESERAGAHRGELADLLRAAGCDEVVDGELTVEVTYRGFDEWWIPYTYGVGPAGAELAALPAADRSRVRAAAASALPDAPFTVTATAWVARGRVVGRPQ